MNLDGKSTTDAINILQDASPPWNNDDLELATYLFIPYCTQDLHIGNKETDYDGADGTMTVHHKGKKNIELVRSWLYHYFESPQTLTFLGCSAGATAPYIEAARADQHYNKINKIVEIASIADSPVF